jgi:Winged helix DNA-binding domain
VHGLDLAGGVQHGDVEPDHQGLAPVGPQVPAEASLVVVRVDWLSGFRQQHLEDLLTERSVVRAHLLRNTVHLVTAEDFLRFRALFQPLMERALAGTSAGT